MRSPTRSVPSDDEQAAEEAGWMAQVAGGDRGAPLVALYECYAGRVYRLGLRTLGDAGAAEELVQETFVRLWRSAPGFDAAQGAVQTFVFTLAHRAACDAQRRAAARPRLAAVQAQEAQPSLASAEPSTEETVERRLFADEVTKALASLRPLHREVLELGYRQQLSQREIAARIGVPLGTVKTRTYHALRELKRALEERRVLV